MAVVIRGLGVVAPLGCSPAAIARAVAAGQVAAPAADGTACDIPLDAIPEDRRGRIGRLDRLCRLMLSASYLAVADAGIDVDALDRERLGLSFGTGLGCLLSNAEYYDRVVEHGPAAASPRLFAYTVSSAAAGEVSIALGIHGPNVTAHMGLAAGLGALGYGCDLIETGRADVVLAGGGDAGGPWLADGLRDMDLLKGREQSRPFADAVPGLWATEGAVVAVLEREPPSPQSPAPSPGAGAAGRGSGVRILGYAAGFEPTLTRRGAEPTALIETMRRALARAGVEPGTVDVVVTAAHGTPLDAVERVAIAAGVGPRPLLLAPKAALGEAFAASGPLGVALAAEWLRQPPAALPGVAFDGSGRPLPPAEAAARLRAARVVAVNAVCYSGNLVSLVLTRE